MTCCLNSCLLEIQELAKPVCCFAFRMTRSTPRLSQQLVRIVCVFSVFNKSAALRTCLVTLQPESLSPGLEMHELRNPKPKSREFCSSTFWNTWKVVMSEVISVMWLSRNRFQNQDRGTKRQEDQTSDMVGYKYWKPFDDISGVSQIEKRKKICKGHCGYPGRIVIFCGVNSLSSQGYSWTGAFPHHHNLLLQRSHGDPAGVWYYQH